MKIEKHELKKAVEKHAGISAVAGIIVWFIVGLYSKKLFESLFFGALAGFLVLAILISIQFRKKKFKTELFRKELPFALNSFALSISLGASFEEALLSVGKGSYGLVSEEFCKALKSIEEKGTSVQEALLSISKKYQNIEIKQAVSRIILIYEQGSRKTSVEAIHKMSSEILRKQKASAQEFSGKIVVFSLAFIAVSAVIPAIFQAYVIIGGLFLKTSFTPVQVFITIAFVFPLLDLIILAIIRSKTPVFLR